MKQIFVSVIIPVYNAEQYLEECLNSIINQTLKDIQIIAVNDGSTDKSLDILNKYKLKDSRINVISIENSKQGKCRNLAMDIAMGKYIYFIDSDDYIKEDALEILLEEIEKDKIEILIFNGRSFYDKLNRFSKHKYFQVNEDYINRTMTGLEFAEKGISFVSPCMKLYRRDFLITNGIRFAEGVYGEDDIFWYKCCLASTKIKYIDKILYFRRIRSNSVMMNKNKSTILNRLDNVTEINKLLNCHQKDQMIYFYNNLSKSALDLMKDIIKFKVNNNEEIKINYNGYKKIIFNNKLGVKYNFKAFIIIYLPFIYKFINLLKSNSNKYHINHF
ncbi:glycosyltransferase [Syntrophomonas erecta subsp. sporosyntropha]